MRIALVSFGYKYGHPVGLDLVLDVRFIPNPFFVQELRPLSGADPRVHRLCYGAGGSAALRRKGGELLEFLYRSTSARARAI